MWRRRTCCSDEPIAAVARKATDSLAVGKSSGVIRENQGMRRRDPSLAPREFARSRKILADSPANEILPVKSSNSRMVVVADEFWVQDAELEGCDVDGCSAVAVPEAYEPLTLHDGAPLRFRLCEEHVLVFLRS